MISAFLSLIVTVSSATAIQVDGDGYLRFAKENSIVYAKHAELKWSGGMIVGSAGDPVWPKIKLEREPLKIEVDLKGKVVARYSDSVIEAGRLVLALFPDDIRPVVSGSYLKLYGDAELSEPGEGLAGVIRPWSPAQTAPPVVEESFVKVHLEESEPLAQKQESIIQIKKVKKTEHVPDEAWLNQGGIEISFPETCEVSGDSMTLKDLADVFANQQLKMQLEAIDFGNAPVFGVPRQVDRNWITSRLKLAGINPALVRIIGPVRIKIERSGQTITQEMFEQTAVQFIAKQYPDFEAIATKPVPDLIAPVGELDLRSENVMKSGTTLSITVVAYVDGKRINSRTLNFANNNVPLNVKVGDEVGVSVNSGSVVIETTGKVKKIDLVTGLVSVQISTGKIMTGKWSKRGKVEVAV